jgi:hypothetical protein
LAVRKQLSGFSFSLHEQPVNGVIWRMAHIGEWHDFNPADRSTYPKVNSPIQVRDATGGRSEGDFLKLVSNARQLLKPKIVGWRYIKDKAIN